MCFNALLNGGVKMSAKMIVILGSLFCIYAGSASAQGVTSITSEFEVSGRSYLYAGAMGLNPADADAQSIVRVAWHRAPVPGGGFEYQSELITPLEFQKGIFVSTYSPDGVAVQPPIRADDPTIDGWPQDPILAADDLGRFVVLWRHAQLTENGALRAEYSIWMRPFDAQGTPLDEARKLTNKTDVLPSIDMAGTGEFVIILGRTEPEDEYNFDEEQPRFWLFDANFQPVHEFPRDIDKTLDRSTYSVLSAVALNELGEFAVAYLNTDIYNFTRNRRMRLRTFAADGTALSEPVEFESESRFFWGLRVEWLNSDQFVAAWLEGGRYGPITGNWQVFSKDGSPVGSRMSSDLARGQGGILQVSDTEFAVIWATESGAVLIPSTAEERSQDIPLAISKTVSYNAYTDYGPDLGDDVSPLSVVALGGGEFAAIFMNTIDGHEQVRAEILGVESSAKPAVFDSIVVGPCVADRTATARLNWSSVADSVEITVAGPPAEKLFARAEGSGEIETGLWARHGMVFKLYDQVSGELLATTKARPDADTCSMSPMVIDPEFFEVCDPREYSSAELLWDLGDISADGAEIRVNGLDGKLFARGGRVGSATTGNWLMNGMRFFLVKPYSSEFLGTATVRYQQKACS
jgi:hypothetical protein